MLAQAGSGPIDGLGGALPSPVESRGQLRQTIRRVLTEIADDDWQRIKCVIDATLAHPRKADELWVAEEVFRNGRRMSKLDEEEPARSHGASKSLIHELVGRIAVNPGLVELITSAEKRLDAVPPMSREDLRWTLYRVSQADRDRMIAYIPLNPELDDRGRDRKLAHDVFDRDEPVEEAGKRYGLTENGAKSALGQMLDTLVARPLARQIAVDYKAEAGKTPAMSTDEARGRLYTLQDGEMEELVGRIPANTWKIRDVMPRHKRVLLDYLKRRGRMSVRGFVEEYGRAHPGDELAVRAADQIIANGIARIADEPGLRKRLGELSAGKYVKPHTGPNVEPAGETLPTPKPAESKEHKAETSEKPTPPAGQPATPAPTEKGDAGKEAAQTQPAPSAPTPPEKGEPGKEGAIPQGQAKPPPAEQPKPPTPTGRGQPGKDAAGEPPAAGPPMPQWKQPHKVVFIHGVEAPSEPPSISRAKPAGKPPTREEFDGRLSAMKALRPKGGRINQTEAYQDIQGAGGDIFVQGDRIIDCINLIRSRPDEVPGMLRHLEESLNEWKRKGLIRGDVNRLALYSTIAYDIGSGEGRAGEGDDVGRMWSSMGRQYRTYVSTKVYEQYGKSYSLTERLYLGLIKEIYPRLYG